jgi:alkanesulfonate monooxygenase SsuD/methylene tetrahydromethanopterin reductase-like flavin-dependent oxidoreductase (luciferase family)
VELKFAVGMGRDEGADEVAELSRTAEESGFSYLTFVDQPALSRDVYACMTIAAMHTRRIRIAQGVTDPVTYRPWVTANATATVDEVSGGRAFVGIGAGGPWGKVMKARPLRELRDAVEFIRRFSAGEEAEFDGVRMRSEWIRRPLRVYLGGAGPRLCQLAGEVADGVMLASNADPVVVKWQLEQIEKGAVRAGRDPSAIDVWARGMIYLTTSMESAHREVAGYAVNSARALYRRLLADGPEIADLRRRLDRERPGLIDECRRVSDAWSPDQHERIDTPASAAVSRRIVELQHLAGPPDDVCEKLTRLAELGIRTFATVTYTIIDKKGMVKEIGDRVISRFRG